MSHFLGPNHARDMKQKLLLISSWCLENVLALIIKIEKSFLHRLKTHKSLIFFCFFSSYRGFENAFFVFKRGIWIEWKHFFKSRTVFQQFFFKNVEENSSLVAFQTKAQSKRKKWKFSITFRIVFLLLLRFFLLSNRSHFQLRNFSKPKSIKAKTKEGRVWQRVEPLACLDLQLSCSSSWAGHWNLSSAYRL